jgi:signal transduction histidine kinase
MIPSVKQIIDLERKLAVSEENINKEKLSIIGDLAARLAHDLRNPLNVIVNNINLMEIKNSNLDEKSKARLKTIKNASARILHQINDVMDFVRTKPPEITHNSILSIIKASVETTFVPSNIKLTLPDIDVVVECDRRQIEVVLSNLILNSIQAIDEAKGAITISISEGEENVIIKVTDSGPGISDGDLPHIFEPLFTTKQKGTGLGLTSCKNIIEQHKGTITVKNNPVTFSITLPKKHKD